MEVETTVMPKVEPVEAEGMEMPEAEPVAEAKEAAWLVAVAMV